MAAPIQFGTQLSYLNQNNETTLLIAYADDAAAAVIRIRSDGQEVPALDVYPKAQAFVTIILYPNGNIKQYESERPDGSYVNMLFADGAAGTATFGPGGEHSYTHGDLTFIRTDTAKGAITTRDFSNGLLTGYTFDYDSQTGDDFDLHFSGNVSNAGTASQLATITMTTPSLGAPITNTLSGGHINSLIGLDGGTLIGLDGATLIGLDGATLIGLDGGTLIGHDGSSINQRDPATLIGHDGSSLIGHDGSSLIGLDGASVIAPGAGAVTSAGHSIAAGIIARDGAGIAPAGLGSDFQILSQFKAAAAPGDVSQTGLDGLTFFGNFLSYLAGRGILSYQSFSAGADDYDDDTTTTAIIDTTDYIIDPVSGALESFGDRDWFKINLTKGREYTFSVNGESNNDGTLADPYLRLYDKDGALIAESDDGGVGWNSSLTYEIPDHGAYYIEAGAFNDAGTGSYMVRVAQAPGGLVDVEQAGQEVHVETSGVSLQQMTTAALKNGNYVVVWSEFFDDDPNSGQTEAILRGQIFDGQGAPVSAVFAVTPEPENALYCYEPDVTATSDGGFLVSYTFGGSTGDVLTQKFNSVGGMIGGVVTVASRGAVNEELSSIAESKTGGHVVAWGVRSTDFSELSINAKFYDAAGNVIAAEAVYAPERGGYPEHPTATALSDGRYLITWLNGEIVSGRIYSAAGAPQGNEFTVASNCHGWGADIAALSDGGFVAVWRDEPSVNGETKFIHAAIFDEDGVGTSSVINVDAAPSWGYSKPSVAVLPDDGFVVSWTQENAGYAYTETRIYRPGGLPDHLEFDLGSTQSMGFSGLAEVSANDDGGFMVFWTYDHNGGNYPQDVDIYGQAFQTDIEGSDDPDSEPTGIQGTAGDDVVDDTHPGATGGAPGAGNDVINTLAGDDTIRGHGGNDAIDGGADTDRAIYGGKRSDYTAAFDGLTGALTLTDTRAGAPDGADTIRNVEFFQFSDSVYTLAQILSNAPLEPEIIVTGNGVGIADNDTAPSPDDHTDFGVTTLGGAPVRTFTIANTGTTDLTITKFKAPAGFVLVDPLPATTIVAPGETKAIEIRLDTSKIGIKKGAISFTTNDGDEKAYNFNLAGVVLAAPTPEIDLSGNGVIILDNSKKPTLASHTDFGGAAFGDAPVVRTFTINNPGLAPLAISNVTAPAGFSLVGGWPASVAAQSSATIQVQLDTSATGARKGDIVITSNDSNEAIFNFTVQGVVTPQNVGGDATDNTFVAAAHAEAFAGGEGSDTVSYAGANGSVVAGLLPTNAKKNAGFAAGDVFDAIENLTGSAFNDTLTGNAAANRLEGGLGADKLDGGSTSKTDIDTASYANAAGGVTADLLKVANNLGEALGDAYKNIENLLGSAFDDRLAGNTLVNGLDGGDGNDVLAGNAGIDTLTGGAGFDTFLFNTFKDGGGATKLAPGVSGDLITDFVSGADAIGIARSGFKILAGVDLSAADALDFAAHYFVSGAGDPPTSTNQTGVTATEAGHGQFLFNETSDQLWWDADGIGKQAAVLLATFQNGAHVLASDFDLL